MSASSPTPRPRPASMAGAFVATAARAWSAGWGKTNPPRGTGAASGRATGPLGARRVFSTRAVTGGGIEVVQDLTLNHSVFLSNTAGAAGAALVLGNATLNGGRFENNSASGGGPGALGVGNNLTLTDSEFVGNRAAGWGAVSS